MNRNDIIDLCEKLGLNRVPERRLATFRSWEIEVVVLEEPQSVWTWTMPDGGRTWVGEADLVKVAELIRASAPRGD